MVALYTGNGSGTKLYQGFLDTHPQIYMLPGYPLMYLYPHWDQWREELSDNWSWPAIVDAFIVQHASVIDTRRIPGFDGLAALGERQDDYIAIDQDQFRTRLLNMLDGEPIVARTFVLAVHYVYAQCRGEDISRKTVLVYHIHVHEYVTRYLAPDFPEMKVIATVRDPRSNFSGRYNSSELAVDEQRYNATDAAIFRRRVYYFVTKYFYNSMEVLRGLEPSRVRVVRHEDLYWRPAEVMRATAEFLGIDQDPCLAQITFGGRLWWGDRIYGMEPMNAVNPRVVALDWKTKIGRIDWLVFEGLFLDYFRRYGYEAYRYRRDGLVDRIVLFLAALLPSRQERRVLLDYLRPARIAAFWRACIAEATGAEALKDYGFNAYYRHKWTQRDLQIWRPRWYVILLATSLRLTATEATRRTRLRLRVAQAVYVTVNLMRYSSAMLTAPWYVVRRWQVTVAAFVRMVRRDNVLPDALGQKV